MAKRKQKLKIFDIQDYLKTNEERVAYFKAVLEEDEDMPFENDEHRKNFIAREMCALAESLGIQLEQKGVKNEIHNKSKRQKGKRTLFAKLWRPFHRVDKR